MFLRKRVRKSASFFIFYWCFSEKGKNWLNFPPTSSLFAYVWTMQSNMLFYNGATRFYNNRSIRQHMPSYIGQYIWSMVYFYIYKNREYIKKNIFMYSLFFVLVQYAVRRSVYWNWNQVWIILVRAQLRNRCGPENFLVHIYLKNLVSRWDWVFK